MDLIKPEIASDANVNVSSRDNSSLNAPDKVGAEYSNPRKDIDKAYWYVREHDHPQWSLLELKKLRRKIDWRIVPIMFCCYTMQFVDKVLLNVCSYDCWHG